MIQNTMRPFRFQAAWLSHVLFNDCLLQTGDKIYPYILCYSSYLKPLTSGIEMFLVTAFTRKESFGVDWRAFKNHGRTPITGFD